MKFPSLTILCTFLPILTANAAGIVYYDATVAGMSGTPNTEATSGTTGASTADAGTLFRIRGLNGASSAQGGTDTVNFSNNGSALQNVTNPVASPAPTLRTTISGLDAGRTYEVFVFFWDDISASSSTTTPTGGAAGTAWDLAAKLSTSGSYTDFSSAPGVYWVTRDDGTVDGNNYNPAINGYSVIPFSSITGLNVLGQGTDTYVDGVDGNRSMFGGLLSTGVTGLTSLSVDIQPSSVNNNRTWYDGIGLRDVTPVPEPGSLLLLGLSAAGMMRRRRQS